MNSTFRASIGAVLIAALPAQALAISCQDARDHGDVLRYALPVSAFALTAGYRDGEGAFQYSKNLVYTGIGTGFFKIVGEKTRPDAGTSTQSFVSGHTSAAFSGASFIYTRYGKGWGIPAYLLAGYTAYSRMCAEKHFADDTLGGAMVAMMSNWYTTSPYPGLGRIYPSFTSNGLELSFKAFFGGNRKPREPATFRPRYRVVFEFGPAKMETNIVRAPNDGGDTIDLAAIEQSWHYTARLMFDQYVNDKHGWSIWYGPYGATDFAEITEPVRFGNEVFVPTDEEVVNTNYRWWDIRATYKYTLVDNERWWAKVGASAQFSETQVDLEQQDENRQIIKNEVVDEWSIAPLIHASGGWRFARKWSIDGMIDGISWGDQDYWNAGVWLRFEPTAIWDIAVGGRAIRGKIDSDELYNKIEFTDWSIQLARSF